MRSLLHCYLLFAGFIVQFYQYQTTVVKIEVVFDLDIHNVNDSSYNDTHALQQIQTQILEIYINGSCILDGNMNSNILDGNINSIKRIMSNKDVVLKVKKLVDIPCSPSNKSGTDIVKKGLDDIQNLLNHLTTNHNHSIVPVLNGSFHIFCGNKTIDNCEDVRKCENHKNDPPVKCMEFAGHSSESTSSKGESNSSKSVTIGATVGTVAALSGLVAAATFLRRKCKKKASVSDDTSDISSTVSKDPDDKLFFPRMFEKNVATGTAPFKAVL